MMTIGKYQILGEIGSSASGKTYRACDSSRKIEVALKVLDSAATVTAELKDEFCRDLAACAELRHPHLAMTREIGEADGALYIATELLPGADLRTQFEEHRSIPLERKLELMARICDGLAAAHSKGIAHGNIKPGNILITAGGDAQVLDFGIGRWLWLILAAGARPEKLFANYFAPEQILGQPFDARSDVFSTALVLYEWLTGKYPFQVPDSLIPREIVHTQLESLRKVAPEIPEALDQLVARALHKDRGQRVQTAAEFAQGLRGIIQQLDRAPGASIPLPHGHGSVPAEPAEPSRPEASSAADLVRGQAEGLQQPHAKGALVLAPVITPAPAPILTPTPAVISVAAIPATPRANQSSLFRKRLIVYSIAAVLAICAFVALLSRQNIRASQSKRPEPSAPVRTIEAKPEPQANDPVPAQPTAVATAATPSAAASPPIPTPEETALLAQIKSAWQAGYYTSAMRLVNQLLTVNPTSAEARAWKKKIRSAQVAEEEMK